MGKLYGNDVQQIELTDTQQGAANGQGQGAGAAEVQGQ